jgi:hypothetical protein
MQQFLFQFHSGVRYLVLLAGIVAAVQLLVTALRGRGLDRTGRLLTATFSGVLDLQVLAGVLLLLVRPFYGALIGHIVMMLLALAIAHGAAIANKRRPEGERSTRVALVGVAIPLLLVAGGITAIGRSLF